jgi:hypothetical protein
MKRKSDIIHYSETDPGIITFNRKDIEAEIPTTITSAAMAYTARGLEGKKCIIIVLRD